MLLLRSAKFVKNYCRNFSAMAFNIATEDIKAEAVAIDLLRDGKIIAVPTDTVYGLACCATDSEAINRMYLIKARDESKPMAICVGRPGDVQKWAVVSHLPEGLLSSLLPGPVTLVLNCANKIDKSLSLHGKVGIRVPDYPFIRNIANGLDFPIALTSANVSKQKSSVRVEEFESLWPKIAGVFDGGELGVEDSNRGASTVIDLSTRGEYKILRTGIAGAPTESILERFQLKRH